MRWYQFVPKWKIRPENWLENWTGKVGQSFLVGLYPSSKMCVGWLNRRENVERYIYNGERRETKLPAFGEGGFSGLKLAEEPAPSLGSSASSNGPKNIAVFCASIPSLQVGMLVLVSSISKITKIA